jgi:hypothetical protein
MVIYWLFVASEGDTFMAFNAGFNVANMPNTYKQNAAIKIKLKGSFGKAYRSTKNTFKATASMQPIKTPQVVCIIFSTKN